MFKQIRTLKRLCFTINAQAHQHVSNFDIIAVWKMQSKCSCRYFGFRKVLSWLKFIHVNFSNDFEDRGAPTVWRWNVDINCRRTRDTQGHDQVRGVDVCMCWWGNTIAPLSASVWSFNMLTEWEHVADNNMRYICIDITFAYLHSVSI